MYRERCGEGVWRFHTLSGHFLPVPPSVHHPGSSLNPVLQEVLQRLHHITINSIFCPSPFPGDQAESSKHGLVFLVTSTHPHATQEPTKGHLIKTKDAIGLYCNSKISSVFCISGVCRLQDPFKYPRFLRSLLHMFSSELAFLRGLLLKYRAKGWVTSPDPLQLCFNTSYLQF